MTKVLANRGLPGSADGAAQRWAVRVEFRRLRPEGPNRLAEDRSVASRRDAAGELERMEWALRQPAQGQWLMRCHLCWVPLVSEELGVAQPVLLLPPRLL